jgi:hypothetical protein
MDTGMGMVMDTDTDTSTTSHPTVTDCCVVHCVSCRRQTDSGSSITQTDSTVYKPNCSDSISQLRLYTRGTISIGVALGVGAYY